MQDKYGNPLRVGDAVMLRGTIKETVHATSEFCNIEVLGDLVTVKTENLEKVLGITPGDFPPAISIQTGPVKEKP